MNILIRLCEAIRTISPYAFIKFDGKGGKGEDLWTGTIGVGNIVIVEHTGTLEEVVDQLSEKLTKLSTGVLTRLSRVAPPNDYDPGPQDPGREKPSAG